MLTRRIATVVVFLLLAWLGLDVEGGGSRRRRPTSFAFLTRSPSILPCLDSRRRPPTARVVAVGPSRFSSSSSSTVRPGWVQRDDTGEWEWDEDDPNYVEPATTVVKPSATPQLPAGTFRPKQSLGQNYLKDPNTVAKIIRAFHQDATTTRKTTTARGAHNDNGHDAQQQQVLVENVVELGPGAGALTDKLVETYGTQKLKCIEIDERSIAILRDKYPDLQVRHADVLQVDYPDLAQEAPLTVIGNLPYYITSQILFALADASHLGAIRTATVTMQWEVGQRLVAKTCTKDYGILSVVFQLYADVTCHFKIPPTVFYPKPKVDSALMGLHFIGPEALRQRLAGVQPKHFRRVVTTAFRQRRKTLRNSLKKLTRELCHGNVEAAQALWQEPAPTLPTSIQKARNQALAADHDWDDYFSRPLELPPDWSSKRPEELTPGQFVELTRLLYGRQRALGGDDDKDDDDDDDEAASALGRRVWRKLKHGSDN